MNESFVYPPRLPCFQIPLYLTVEPCSWEGAASQDVTIISPEIGYPSETAFLRGTSVVSWEDQSLVEKTPWAYPRVWCSVVEEYDTPQESVDFCVLSHKPKVGGPPKNHLTYITQTSLPGEGSVVTVIM